MANDETAFPPSAGEPDSNTVHVRTRYALPQADVLRRNRPASLEGPPERWDAARTVIDFGCALLVEGNKLRDERRTRDAVLAALLRRALITGEGVLTSLNAGLEESALILSRTLLDIWLHIKLVVSDKTDTMAKRLAAYHYYSYQRHGQKMLADSDTRKGPLSSEEGVTRTREVAKSYARFLEAPVFDEVREQVRESQYWHGMKNVSDAFRVAQAHSEYTMAYDASTFFVHATNVDHDFADIVDGQLRLKALLQRDPAMTGLHLGVLALRLRDIYDLILEDRGVPELFSRTPDIDPGDPDTLGLDGVSGLMVFIVQQFGDVLKPAGLIATDSSGAR